MNMESKDLKKQSDALFTEFDDLLNDLGAKKFEKCEEISCKQ